jgi:hypothetical protein
LWDEKFEEEMGGERSMGEVPSVNKILFGIFA